MVGPDAFLQVYSNPIAHPNTHLLIPSVCISNTYPCIFPFLQSQKQALMCGHPESHSRVNFGVFLSLDDAQFSVVV
jgi:hypothetical protein